MRRHAQFAPDVRKMCKFHAIAPNGSARIRQQDRQGETAKSNVADQLTIEGYGEATPADGLVANAVEDEPLLSLTTTASYSRRLPQRRLAVREPSLLSPQ